MTTVRFAMIVTEYYDMNFEEFKYACDNKFDEKTLTKIWKNLLRRKNDVVLGKTFYGLQDGEPLIHAIQDFVTPKATPSRPRATLPQEPPHKTPQVPVTKEGTTGQGKEGGS